MLDQYQGALTCKINYNNGDFAEAEIIDAVKDAGTTGIDDEFWFGVPLQIYHDMVGMDEDKFKAAYPVGSEFDVEFKVRVLTRGMTPQEREVVVEPVKARPAGWCRGRSVCATLANDK